MLPIGGAALYWQDEIQFISQSFSFGVGCPRDRGGLRRFLRHALRFAAHVPVAGIGPNQAGFAATARAGPDANQPDGGPSLLNLMRLPLALTAKIAAHIVKTNCCALPSSRWSATGTAPHLQPDLHRVRAHPRILHQPQGHDAPGGLPGLGQECDAPMVSICGGEPLIYPKIEELVDGLLRQGRIVYVCTNGMFMRKKMRIIWPPSTAETGSRSWPACSEKS
jgi:hypothetical protein